MNLIELYNDNQSDKNTIHSYLDTYEKLMGRLKDSAINILEVGIGDHFANINYMPHGGSLILWSKYFKNATIYGVEILNFRLLDEIISNDRIITFMSTDAYDINFIENNLKDKKFDVLMDDGPHTLESQKNFIELYSSLLNENGLLIIEDVQDIKWLDELTNITPPNLKQYIKTFDLRSNKDRYDDIIFVIDKSIN